MKIKCDTKLFTLTELLIVLAVFFILLSLLSPALKNSIESARGIVCSKKLSVLPQLNFAYADDHNGSLATQQYWTNMLLEQAGESTPFVATTYEKYYGCPSGGRDYPPDYNRSAWAYSWVMAAWPNHPSKKLTDLKLPSEILMFIENKDSAIFNPHAWKSQPYSPHANFGYQAYCDGHISKLTQEEMLFYCKNYPNNIPWWSP